MELILIIVVVVVVRWGRILGPAARPLVKLTMIGFPP
ncbi:hypothetical protein ACVMHR_001251 [Bradyrhizobium diazoefficiens]